MNNSRVRLKLKAVVLQVVVRWVLTISGCQCLAGYALVRVQIGCHDIASLGATQFKCPQSPESIACYARRDIT